ncbi:hypothetical protein ACFE04_029275 [Oxalis oulophora]
MELSRCISLVILPKISARPSLNVNNISLPKKSTRHALNRPIVQARMSSLPSKDGNEIGKGSALGASIALACALGVIGCCNTKIVNNRAFASVLPETIPIAEASPLKKTAVNPVGDAIKSFLEVIEQLALEEVQHFKYKYHARRVKNPSPADINLFKKEMLELIKLGKGDAAIAQLQKECEINKDHPESALNLEIALIEVYISQGKFKEALECNRLKDDHESSHDKRIPLYKAIAHTMLAKQFWEELAENYGGFTVDQTSRTVPIKY